MIRIAITAEAFEAIKATLPLGSIWLERFGGRQAVLRASQGRGGERHNRLLSRRIRVPLDLQEAAPCQRRSGAASASTMMSTAAAAGRSRPKC